MPRIARVVVPRYPHHVTQRGNRRQQIFFCDNEYPNQDDNLDTDGDGIDDAYEGCGAGLMTPAGLGMLPIIFLGLGLMKMQRAIHRPRKS